MYHAINLKIKVNKIGRFRNEDKKKNEKYMI